MPGPTLKDIAQKAGVSMQAVSLVLNGKAEGQVSNAKAEKICSIAKKLNFRSNIYVRRIRNTCADSLTLIIDDLKNSSTLEYSDFRNKRFSDMILNGIIEGAMKYNFDVKLLPLNRNNEQAGEHLDRHIGYPFSDGVIFLGLHYQQNFHEVVVKRKLPYIVISPHRTMNEIPSVNIEADAAVRESVRYLISKGHRRIAYSAHRSTDEDYLPSRFRGYEQEMNEAGLFDRNLLITVQNERSIREYAMRKDIRKRFTAILCMNDVMADRWRRELIFNEYRVPEDFAIIGYDGYSEANDLSTIDTKPYQCGYLATSLLIDSILNKKFPESKSLTAEFINKSTS